MSEPHDTERSKEDAASAQQPEEIAPPAVAPTPPRGESRLRGGLWPAALLLLGIAGVALSPFWAPEVAPLLPWGARPAVSADEYAALTARVRAIEKQPVPMTVDAETVKSSVSPLSSRVDRLETTVNSRLAELEKRQATPVLNVDTIKSAVNELRRRVDEVEAVRKPDRQTEAADTADKAALHQLEQRVAVVEAQSSSRTAGAVAELQKLQQEVSRLDNGVAAIAHRLPAVERQVQVQIGSGRRDAVAALLLLQMREAVDQARPFPAAYNAFKALAHDPELAAAAEPLAAAAQNGVASRAVLGKRLGELAERVATATEPPAPSDWWAQALAQLRGLVTIRRIDSASQSAPEAAVQAAQTALARGDLADAVTGIETLSGPDAEPARSWLQMARERLSVERTLDHLRALLTARLGGNVPAPAPANVPAEPSGTKAPS